MEDEGALMSLHCGHWACTACWTEHMVQQLENRHSAVGCIGMGCSLVLPESDLLAVAPAETVERYHKLLLESFISCRSNLKWCPTPDCGVVVKAEYGGAVTCKSCRESFCFKVHHLLLFACASLSVPAASPSQLFFVVDGSSRRPLPRQSVVRSAGRTTFRRRAPT